MSVEDCLARRVEFGEVWLFAPPDERVAVGEHLVVALAAGQQCRGVNVAADQRDGAMVQSMRSRMTRDWECSLGVAPLSKIVIVWSGCQRMLCW